MQDHAASPGSPGIRRPDSQPLLSQQTAFPPSGIHADSRSPRHAPVHGVAYNAPGQEASRASQFANALGWFSIGLGLAQLLVPRRLSQAIGVPDSPVVMRALGAREIAAGVGLLQKEKPTGFLWARVAGDAMDLALLGAAARSGNAQRNRIALAAAAVAGIALVDLLTSVEHTQQNQTLVSADGAVHVFKTITINRTAEECYRFWHDFENFPRFMKHLQSVEITGENRMHWVAKGPAGTSVAWDAELVADQPGRYLAWRSLEGADVDNEGTVHFEPASGGRGTVVRVELQYRPPMGAAGALVAKLFGEEPEMQVDEDLRRFKWLIETGEIPTTVGQTSGPRGVLNRLLWRKGAPG
ncbi:SRPBCC family protein [Noviherbaspirillum galbum]|uniref:SRPBCC family protein n=1 Tax=Noviherbaspirillum galbum TaxID=2709383 RepID=A0A6B3SQZ1_9BURK|nr:SRPBCC family protein [Noviherbaspirillum galbum]NEX63184.1 SRPBCC family protein [Noviherbaspirillum galbum]